VTRRKGDVAIVAALRELLAVSEEHYTDNADDQARLTAAQAEARRVLTAHVNGDTVIWGH
jgi:hypothetical protein